MATPIQVFQSLVKGDIVSKFGRSVAPEVVGTLSASARRNIVTRALRGVAEEVGLFTGIQPIIQYARRAGLNLADDFIRSSYQRVIDVARANDRLSRVGEDDTIPDDAISSSSWAFSREYKYNFTVVLEDENTGQRVTVTRSMVSNRRFSRTEAEDEFEDSYEPDYSDHGINIIDVTLIGVERRREPLI